MYGYNRKGFCVFILTARNNFPSYDTSRKRHHFNSITTIICTICFEDQYYVGCIFWVLIDTRVLENLRICMTRGNLLWYALTGRQFRTLSDSKSARRSILCFLKISDKSTVTVFALWFRNWVVYTLRCFVRKRYILCDSLNVCCQYH